MHFIQDIFTYSKRVDEKLTRSMLKFSLWNLWNRKLCCSVWIL